MKPEMTGYDTEDRYYATRYKQGGRTVYSLELSLTGVVATIPKPDPRKLQEGNRQINEPHARSFGQYVRANPNWIAPALLLRSSNIFKFKVQDEIGGTQFGILSVPRLARTDLKILDGQHRVLGLHYAIETVASDIEKTKNLLAAARKQETQTLIGRYEAQLKELETERARLDRDRIAVEIYLEDEAEAYKQMFVDIAENARGITNTIKTRFDHRKVVNRALGAVMGHALLDDRVDLQQDRVSVSSPKLMGAKHVADIIRTVAVGISGRVSRKQEAELQEAELAEKANNFLDVLINSFPVLNEVVEKKCTPERLRKISLLGSTTMLRVLAGVYYELSKEKSDDEIGDFFAKLAPQMGAPVTAASEWVKIPGEVFSPGTTAPKARYQDLQRLTDTIVSWAGSKQKEAATVA